MAFAISGDAFRWPDGIMPYEISADFTADQRDEIESAIAHWNQRTIMRLIPRAGQADFVVFRPASDVCQSAVGRNTGAQEIGCDIGDGFGRGSIIHEIGHAAGYFHEQQRPDRDQFVQINKDNIEVGKEGNFDIRSGITLGPYDYGSIMHYPRGAFSDNGDTIVPLQDVDIGQRDGLSDRDSKGICLLFQAPHFVAAWEDDAVQGGRADVRWAGLARWGKYCWGPMLVESSGGARGGPNVAIDDDRTSVVVWEENGDGSRVHARCVTVDGAERFDSLQVSTGAGEHQAPDLAMEPSGDLVVVWQTRLAGGAQEIRARGFSRAGQERFAELTVSAGAGGIPASPAIGLDATGGFVVVWAELVDESLAVRARGFERDGTQRFAELTVASDLGDQDVFPRVAVAGDGSFVVVWELATRDVRARGFLRTGEERFGEIAVNARPIGDQLLADVAITPAGQFLVVWTDDRNENNIGQLRARAFFADGTEARAEFTANPRGGGDQLRPRVGLDREGRAYLVWEDDEDRNGKFQIHAHGVDAADQVFLKSFTVNRIWQGQQRRPAVATR